jgi:hypothetical protein
MRKAVTEGKGAYCTRASTVNRGNIENASRIRLHSEDFSGSGAGLLLNPTSSGVFSGPNGYLYACGLSIFL